MSGSFNRALDKSTTLFANATDLIIVGPRGTDMIEIRELRWNLEEGGC